MSKHCPYLGLKESRDQVALEADARHRCYYTREPERIASSFQASTCLSDGYLRCPRLATRLPAPRRAARPQPVPPPPVATSSTERYTDLRPLRRSWRRRSKPFEFLIVGLVLSLVVGALSLGYAVSHRPRVGPGIEIVAAVGATTTGAALSPTSPATVSAAATATPMLTSPPATLTPPSPTPVFTLPPATPTPEPRPLAISPPTRLVIARIDLDIPVKPVGPKEIREGASTRFVWGDVPNAGAFHNTSAYPGNSGNTVINGHRDIQGAVFAHLDRVEVGDEIVLYVKEVAYRYQVTEVLIVPETFASAKQRADNVALIGAYPEERLTLVTCTPVGLATHRLVVIARPPDLVVPQMPIAGSEP